MKKNILMMSLMAGALIFSSCASKKDLENCRLDNQSLQNEYQLSGGKGAVGCC